ncbi:MAG: hypothetical protein ACLUDU_14775 [Butyricimonas faecihominis]
MRKLIYILLIGVFIACSEEETLTPMEVKNWYVITPTENMDEVDDMIYRLYEKYDLAIFYKDTIGMEDRGWKDENGDPKFYYEVLRLDYDMTEIANIQTKITFNKVDVTNPESKAAMMPLLKLLNEKLLAWIDFIYQAILIVQIWKRNEAHVCLSRVWGLGFALNGYNQIRILSSNGHFYMKFVMVLCKILCPVFNLL